MGTFTHTGAEKEATPKGRAEQTNKKKREGKDVAVQTAKAEEATISMNQKSCRNKAKQGQKPEQEQHRKLAKDAPKPLDKEGAAATIQSSRKYIHREGAVKSKKVNAQTVFETSVDANSSVPQTFTHTDAEKEATPKGRAEKTNKKNKEGKDVALQKAKAEGGAREKKEQQKFAQGALPKPLDKEGAAATIQSSRKYIHREGAVEAKRVNAQTVFENSVDANSSVPQTFTHTGAEKEAIPKGRAEKTNKKKKEGKDVAVQKAKAEGGAREGKQQLKFAQEAVAKPLDKEGAAATIQSSQKYIHREGAV